MKKIMLAAATSTLLFLTGCGQGGQSGGDDISAAAQNQTSVLAEDPLYSDNSTVPNSLAVPELNEAANNEQQVENQQKE